MNNSAWRIFRSTVWGVNRLMAYIAAILILGCTLVLVYEVVTRYVIHVSNDWVIELSIYMLIAATFLAAAHTQRERAHVGIEVLDEVMSAQWNRWRYLLGDTLSMLFCGLVAFLCWEYWHEAYEGGWESSSTWAPKMWIPFFFMALGMSLLVLQYVVQIVEDITEPAKHKEHEFLGE